MSSLFLLSPLVPHLSADFFQERSYSFSVIPTPFTSVTFSIAGPRFPDEERCLPSRLHIRFFLSPQQRGLFVLFFILPRVSPLLFQYWPQLLSEIPCDNLASP